MCYLYKMLAVCQKESNSEVYWQWDSFTPISWKRGALKTLVEREYIISSTPRLLVKKWLIIEPFLELLITILTG